MRGVVFLCLVFLFAGMMIAGAQSKVTFRASDSLLITADLYLTDKSRPYVLLFHQAGYSRGEYKQSARKIQKFGYNCLAVDLRSGGEVNYIQNRTALRALQQGYSTDYLSSMKDIRAAIDWVETQSREPVILFGSSFSASLCLMVAKENPKVQAVVAFSPGEFFRPEDVFVKEQIDSLSKPIFVASSKREYPYAKELLSLVPSSNKLIFAPDGGQGEHGSKSLWSSNPTSQEYWLALTMFFSQIRSVY